MSEYNFTRFTSKGSKLGNYSISINRSSSFGFNSGFYTRENIRRFKRVILFFDKNKSAVGFQFTNDGDAEGSFALTHGKNSGSASAISFFVGNNLKGNQRYLGKRVPKKENDSRLGTLYVIDLLSNRK